jgi:hypothetical protein
MSDRIEPALTLEEWANADGPTYDRPYCMIFPADAASGGIVVSVGSERAWVAPQDLPPAIALANAALPDDDPRKITHDMVAAIRDVADTLDRVCGAKMIGSVQVHGPAGSAYLLRDDFGAIADALESYLPPEGQ